MIVGQDEKIYRFAAIQPTCQPITPSDGAGFRFAPPTPCDEFVILFSDNSPDFKARCMDESSVKAGDGQFPGHPNRGVNKGMASNQEF
jgi:hypothetical protein